MLVGFFATNETVYKESRIGLFDVIGLVWF